MSLRTIARALFLLLVATVIISAQEYPPAGVPVPNPDDNTIGSLGVQLITQFLTGDFVRRKIQVLFDLIDLKARLIYVVTSFCTTENLIALKRFLDWVCRLANFINQFLPTIPEDNNPRTALLGLILNTFGGFSSTAPVTPVPGPVYGPPTIAPTYGPPTVPPSYGPPTVPPSYGPPTVPPAYGPPTIPPAYGPPKVEGSGFVPEVQTFRPSEVVKRSPQPQPEPEFQETNDMRLSELSEDDVRRMLRNNEGILTLSKLISASRKR